MLTSCSNLAFNFCLRSFSRHIFRKAADPWPFLELELEGVDGDLTRLRGDVRTVWGVGGGAGKKLAKVGDGSVPAEFWGKSGLKRGFGCSSFIKFCGL